MKTQRMSFAELKQKATELKDVSAIKGGAMAGCHAKSGLTVPPKDKLQHHK